MNTEHMFFRFDSSHCTSPCFDYDRLAPLEFLGEYALTENGIQTIAVAAYGKQFFRLRSDCHGGSAADLSLASPGPSGINESSINKRQLTAP